MDKVKQAVDKIVHPKDHSSTTGTTAHSTTTSTHTGNHTGAHTGATGHSTGVTGTSGGVGPHSSSLANKADPMVDSDLDGSRNAMAAQHGPGGVHNNQHSTGFTGAGTTGTAGTHGTSATGPHSSNLANKLDPRVDSDRDGSRNAGAAQYGPGSHQSHGTTAMGLTGSHGTSGMTGSNYGSTNAGPHSSNAMNSMDPRVDSDRDGSRNMGASQYGPGGAHNQHNSGLTGNNHGSGLTGTSHSSGLTGSNYSSGLTGNNHGTHMNDGPAPNTAGAHKSDMMNKLDPRIDSDRDGSKTVGQAPPPQY